MCRTKISIKRIKAEALKILKLKHLTVIVKRNYEYLSMVSCNLDSVSAST